VAIMVGQIGCDAVQRCIVFVDRSATLCNMSCVALTSSRDPRLSSSFLVGMPQLGRG